jgi:hypothetical protein
MATRNIHKKQPLAKRSKTLKKLGSITALHKLPRWEKYLKFGRIAEELGKEKAALRWRKRAYSSALDRGEYANAEAFASAYISKQAAEIANSLAILKENVSSGRVNGEVSFLVENAIRAGAPRELIAWEINSVRRTYPELTFHQWKSNPQLSYKMVS